MATAGIIVISIARTEQVILNPVDPRWKEPSRQYIFRFRLHPIDNAAQIYTRWVRAAKTEQLLHVSPDEPSCKYGTAPPITRL